MLLNFQRAYWYIEGDTVRIMEPVAKVDLSGDGSTILIITESGVTIEKPVGDEMLIVDSEGNETIVREDGTIEKPGGLITRPGGGSPGDPPQTDNPKLKALELPLVEFAPVQDQKYGFDKLEQQALAGKYEITEIRGSPYSVPWKSVEVGRTDDLVAEHPKINDKQATGAVKFKTLAANLPAFRFTE